MPSEKSRKVLQAIIALFLLLLAGLLTIYIIQVIIAQASKEVQWQEWGPKGVSILTLENHPTIPDILYTIVDGHGIYKSQKQGETWYFENQGIEGITVCFGISNKTPEIMYAGTRDSGIFRSTDGGETWRSTNFNIKDKEDDKKLALVHSLAVVDDLRVYAGVSDRGIYKSENGGESWNPLNTGLRLSLEVLTILPHPDNDNVLYIGTSRGIFKSEDGGNTWEQKSNYQTNVLTFAEGSALYGGGEGGLYVSTDAGEKWEYRIQAKTNRFGEVNSLWFCEKENSLWVGCHGAIYEIPGNRSLKPLKIGETLGDSLVVRGIVKNGEYLYIGTGRGIYRSSDNGENWDPLTKGLPKNGLIVKAIAFDKKQDNILYIATWGSGVYKTDTKNLPESNVSQQSWDHYNQDLCDPYITKLQTSEDRVYTTTWKTLANAERIEKIWKTIFTSDDLPKPSKLSNCENLIVSNETVFTIIKTGEPEGNVWKYWNRLFRSYDAWDSTPSWDRVKIDCKNHFGNITTVDNFTNIVVTPQEYRTGYVVTKECGTLVINYDDRGNKWESLSEEETIRAITIGETDEKTLYACTDNVIKRFLEKGVWEKIARRPCRTVIMDPTNPERLYTADDEGVLIIRPDKSPYWIDTLKHIEVKINDIAVDPNRSNIIYVATEGGSVWWADIKDLIDPPLLVHLRRMIRGPFSSLSNWSYLFCVEVVLAIAILFKLLIIIKPPKVTKISVPIVTKREFPAKLRKEIIKFLTSLPNIHGKSERQALIFSAGLDEKLVTQLSFDESPSVFFPRLVDTCVRYGKQRDGRDPLIEILKAAKNTVGQDKREICADLISHCSAFNGGDDEK